MKILKLIIMKLIKLWNEMVKYYQSVVIFPLTSKMNGCWLEFLRFPLGRKYETMAAGRAWVACGFLLISTGNGCFCCGESGEISIMQIKKAQINCRQNVIRYRNLARKTKLLSWWKVKENLLISIRNNSSFFLEN